jgi:hypothetical protein
MAGLPEQDARATFELAALDGRVGEFWAMLECARYCVGCRLRTALGGPMQVR